MKAHLLHSGRDFDFTAPLPAGHEDLVKDLELGTLLQAMADGDKFLYEVAEKVLLAPVPDPEAIRYRQRILADCLEQPAVIREIYALATAALTDRSRYWGLYGAHYQTPSSNLSGALSHLESFTARLRQLRKIADDHAGKFRCAGLTALFATLQDQLGDEYFAEVSRHLRQLRFRDGVLISAELAADNTGVNFVLCAPSETARYPWRDWLRIGSRSSYGFTLPPRDEAGGRFLDDLTSRGVNLVANAAAQSADHIASYFTMLRAEVGFYVGCLNLHDRLTDKGVPLAVPEPASPSTQAFSCADLRDAALELQSPDPVVGNDVPADGKTVVIITGANSGGKSTFLRSVGQAQLMMQCGLFTTAARYTADVATGIFTHFIRAEDPSMTSGRLDDELKRMSVIAGRLGPHSLMLFNESFAGTNEREGSEIGYQVVSALLDARVKVLFVTHRYDFAERFRRQHADSTLFLRAERWPDGRRNYKLAVSRPLPASFGEDLYYRLGGWLGENAGPAGDLGWPGRVRCVSSAYPRDGEFLTLAEIHAAALRHLPQDTATYLESGAGTEQTLHANREAFTRWVIKPRPMSGVSDPKTSTSFLGIPLSAPVLTAPFGGDALFAHDGHLAVARANAACGTVSVVPEVGSFSYEEVAAAAPAAARIGQLHPYDSFDFSAARIKAAGYDALCVTVDCPVVGFRARNRMARFRPDPAVWGGNVLPDGSPNVASTYRANVVPAWTWDQLAEATARHGMPWIAKGILTVEAAEAALGAGASAIGVSNHGGRQVDPSPAALDVLPSIASAVSGQVPVLLDSGVRTGADVFIALALGASAVAIGRLAAYGLAAAGEQGVRRTIELLTQELHILMTLSGIPDIPSLTRNAVAPRP